MQIGPIFEWQVAVILQCWTVISAVYFLSLYCRFSCHFTTARHSDRHIIVFLDSRNGFYQDSWLATWLCWLLILYITDCSSPILMLTFQSIVEHLIHLTSCIMTNLMIWRTAESCWSVFACQGWILELLYWLWVNRCTIEVPRQILMRFSMFVSFIIWSFRHFIFFEDIYAADTFGS